MYAVVVTRRTGEEFFISLEAITYTPGDASAILQQVYNRAVGEQDFSPDFSFITEDEVVCASPNLTDTANSDVLRAFVFDSRNPVGFAYSDLTDFMQILGAPDMPPEDFLAMLGTLGPESDL